MQETEARYTETGALNNYSERLKFLYRPEDSGEADRVLR